jgi:hypothetical protein
VAHPVDNHSEENIGDTVDRRSGDPPKESADSDTLAPTTPSTRRH